MVHKLFYISVLVCFIYACKKKVNAPEPCPEPIPKEDSIYFMFVNRLGYKNDSVNIGGGVMRYFAGMTIRVGYFNVNTNKSNMQMPMCWKYLPIYVSKIIQWQLLKPLS
jgi:hypothetical protein